MSQGDTHITPEQWRLLTGQHGRSRRTTGIRRLPPLRGAQCPAFSSVTRTETGYVLTWVNWLPKISGHQLSRYDRSRLCRLARQVFGEWPRGMHEPRRARVEVIRVLGPRQKPMDRDSLAQLTAGLVDSLKRCGYVTDDSERWATLTYTNDGTRRHEGPSIIMTIDYLEILP
jgi:hypothetical protein